MNKSPFVPLESLLETPRKRVTDLGALREKLASGSAPQFWRTLEEAAESEEMSEYIEQEFPSLAGSDPARGGPAKSPQGDECFVGDGWCGSVHQAA